MSRPYLVWTVVLIASAGWLGGCAASADPAAGEHAYWQRVGMSLKDSTQPREQALAAQLHGLAPMSDHDGAQSTASKSSAYSATGSGISGLLEKASGADDAVALSIAMQAAVKRRDQQAISSTAARWRAVEPDNLAPRLFTGEAVGAVLAGARDTTRYETHAYDQIRLMTSVFKRWPMSREEMGPAYTKAHAGDEERAAVNSFAIWAASGIPAFQKLSNACRDEALLSAPERRDDCLHVARVMAGNSSDLLSKGIGISILERAAITPEDVASAVALRRNKEWQQHQYYAVLTNEMDERQQVSDMVRLLKTPGVDNEIELMEAALREKGVALIPPKDWQPPRRS